MDLRLIRRFLLFAAAIVLCGIFLLQGLVSVPSVAQSYSWQPFETCICEQDQSSLSRQQEQTTQVSSTAQQSLSSTNYEIPKLIWQKSNPELTQVWANKSATWSTLNADYKHEVLTDETARDFVHDNYQHRPAVIRFWDNLNIPVVQADFLRYLMMYKYGGVYCDIDTSGLVPIDEWIPAEYRGRVNVAVGVEYDDNTYRMFVRPISFAMWTLMTSPGHEIFRRAIGRVMSNLEFLARRKRVELSDLKLEKAEVLEATGPGMWTDIVMEMIREQGALVDWSTFHDLKTPLLFGDILVFPINAFSGHQKHSHSGDAAYGPKLMQHHFAKSWYKKPQPAA